MAHRTEPPLTSTGAPRVVIAPPTRGPVVACLRGAWIAAVGLVREHPVLAGVVALYLLSLAVIPVTTNVSVLDDWVYLRSGRALALDGYLHVPDEAAANAVFDIVWGAAFARVLGASFWVFRLSSIVLTLLGGFGMYWLCRQLGVDRTMSGLATGLMLFNPLVFVMSFTFMTDAHFMALAVITTACYVRSLAGDRAAARWAWIGSAVAALAYLSRQQGLVLPTAMLVFLLVTRQIGVNRAGLVAFARVAALPALTVVLHRLWLEVGNGVPAASEYFLDIVREAGVRDTGLLVGRLTFIEIMYLGLFTLPIVAALVVAARRAVTRMSARGWIAFGALAAVIGYGLTMFGRNGRRMPYLPNWFTSDGIGSFDVLEGGHPFFGDRIATVLTAVSALAAAGLGFLVLRAAFDRTMDRRPEAFLVAIVLAAMVAAVVAPSIQFRDVPNAPSLDRYLLPLVPFTIALAAWATQRLRLSRAVFGVGVALLAVFTIAGTRDFLVFHGEVWDLARDLNEEGVANDELDAGAAWDRYHLNGQGEPVERDPTLPTPWWVDVDGGLTTSEYAIATASVPGYEIVRRIEYSSWLHGGDTYLLLLRAVDAPDPESESSGTSLGRS